MENELFYIIFTLSIVAMFFGYNLQLEKRTFKLEKKNGHEQDQINQLKAKVKELEAEIDQLREAYQASQQKLAKYQNKHKRIEY